MTDTPAGPRQASFGVLGPVTVTTGGRDLPLDDTARTVLAALLVEPNLPVADEALAERVGAGTVADALEILGAVLRCGGVPADTLERRAGTTTLHVGPDDLDEFRLLTLLDRGRRRLADGDHRGAAAQAAAGWELWRGQPFAGVAGRTFLTAPAARLARLREETAVLLAEADLPLGRAAASIPRLRGLLAGRSGDAAVALRRVLALALAQAGRREEAVTTCREGGTSPVLRRLAHDLRTGTPPPPRPARTGRLRGIDAFRLPPDVPQPAARADVVARVVAALERPAVVVVTGPAGAGTTTVAVAAAHRLRRRYPDGVLYVRLDGDGADPYRLLGGVLLACGLPRAALPDTAGERRALYLAELDRHRMLILLDDATGPARVRPLLPAAGGARAAAVLVAGRGIDDLPGEHVVLRPLPGATARETAVRAAYERADAATATALGLRAAVDLPDLPLWAEVAVLGGDPADAEETARALAAGGWTEVSGRDRDGQPRHRLPRVVRDVVRERSVRDPDAAGRVGRAYLAMLRHAARALVPGLVPLLDHPGAATVPADRPAAPARAPGRWFEQERETVVALAGQVGDDPAAWLLPAAAVEFFELHAHWEDWDRTHRGALAATRRAGDRLAEANTLRNLGRLEYARGRPRAATGPLTTATGIFRELGHPVGVGCCLRQLGQVTGDLALLERAEDLLRTHGSDLAVARTLVPRGDAERAAGRLDASRGSLAAAADLYRRLGNDAGEYTALLSLARTERAAGRPAAAVALLERCRSGFRRPGETAARTAVLVELGELSAPVEALRVLDAAMLLLDPAGAPAARTRVLRARVLRARGAALTATGAAGAADAFRLARALETAGHADTRTQGG